MYKLPLIVFDYLFVGLEFVGLETITKLIICLLRHVFLFKRLCYDLFSDSFELQLFERTTFKMTSTFHV